MREARIAEQLDEVLRHLSRLRRQAALEYAGGEFLSDLTGRQEELLRRIAEAAPCTLSQVALRQRLTKGSVSVAVRTLERKGCISLSRNPADRRELVIEVNGEVKRHLDNVDERFRRRLRDCWSRCDELILDELSEHLELLNHSLKTEEL